MVNKGLIIDRVYRFHDMKRDVPWMKWRYGKTITLPHPEPNNFFPPSLGSLPRSTKTTRTTFCMVKNSSLTQNWRCWLGVQCSTIVPSIHIDLQHALDITGIQSTNRRYRDKKSKETNKQNHNHTNQPTHQPTNHSTNKLIN